MTRFLALWVSLAFLLSPVGALRAADASRATSAVPCPGASAWREARRDQLPPAMAQRDQSRTFSAPELRAELQRRGMDTRVGQRIAQEQRQAAAQRVCG